MSRLARRTSLWSAIIVLISMNTVLRTAAEEPVSNRQPAFDVMEGDRIAHTLCVNCHVVDTRGPVIRTDRVPSFSWITNQKGLTPTTLPAWLSSAHERMPDFNLTRDEIRQVSAYILSLRK